MDLYEYQAKDLFAVHGVPTQAGEVVTTPEAARAAAEKIGQAVMVKAQVKAGGRGKAGGVKFAATPEAAEEHAQNILGLVIKDLTVHQVLVTPAADIAEEYYASLPARPHEPHLPRDVQQGGRHGDRGAGGRAARGPRAHPRPTPSSGATWPRPPRSPTPPGSRATSAPR